LVFPHPSPHGRQSWDWIRLYNHATFKSLTGRYSIPSTFPSPLPAHQGLVYPLVRRWPASFDVIALSVGAAMPDFVDIIFGYLLQGYFRHWFAHSLIFIPFNILGGLLLAWLIHMVLSKFFKKEADQGKHWLRIWIFSVTVGVLSHLLFDLISHDTNLLLYPWHADVRWFPEWWYTPWFVIGPPLSMGPPYSVGIHTIIWLILSGLGTFLFYQFVFQEIRSAGRKDNFPRL
jgi:hypothetical protein